MSYTLYRCLYPENGNQFLAQQLLGHPFISTNLMLHGLSNNITSDKLDAENIKGEIKMACDISIDISVSIRKKFKHKLREEQTKNKKKICRKSQCLCRYKPLEQ